MSVKWKPLNVSKSYYHPPKKYSVEITKQPRNAISNILSLVSVILSAAVAIVTVYSYMKNSHELQESQIYSQARLISAWIHKELLGSSEGYTVADVNNLSNSPVYHVVITSVFIGNGNTTPATGGLEMRNRDPYTSNGAYISIFPPGKYKCSIAPIGGVMGKRFGLEISFRDANGRSWILNADGRLSQIKKDPFAYYPVPSPMDYADLETQ